MNLKFTFPILLLIIFSCNCYAQKSIIKGYVVDESDKPVDQAWIYLKDSSVATYTDVNGFFQMDVRKGCVNLVCRKSGFEPFIRNINIKSDSFILKITLHEIIFFQSVDLIGDRSVNEYSPNIGKSNIKTRDLPQSTMVIEKTTLDNQQVLRVTDVLKNTNGLYIMGNTGGTQEEIAGRGFAFGNSNTFKNGSRFNNGAIPEISGMESVEVLKGSAAILFGNVAPGGVINLITRKPKFEKGGEIHLRTGSFSFYKPFIDYYAPIGEKRKAAYRINTSYENAGSFREKVYAERFYINPSLQIKLSPKTIILLEGDYMKDSRTSDFGTGAINYQLTNIPRSRFLGAEWSYYNTEQRTGTVTTTHFINEHWEIRNITSYQGFQSDLFGTTRPNNINFIKPSGLWVRGVQRTKVAEEYFLTEFDLTGKFKTGKFSHQLLTGADADKYFTTTTAYNTINRYDSINIYNIGEYRQRTDVPELTVRTITKAPVSRSGIYVQDLVSVSEQWKILAGVRYSYQETYSNLITLANQSQTKSVNYNGAFTPRFGLVYQPSKETSLFSSYANSYTLNTGTDITGKALSPSFINQYEAGLKQDFLKGKLSANLTFYKIVNSNLAQTSLQNGNTNSNIKELTGEVTSKGVELDLSTKSIKGISFLAGYSFNDTRYTSSNTYIVGSKLRYNPNHTGNASVYYTFEKGKLKGLSGGATSVYIGKRFAGRSTRITVPNDAYKLIAVNAYTQLDVYCAYQISNLVFKAKVYNVTNTLSYNIHDDNSINPIAPRIFMLSVGVKL